MASGVEACNVREDAHHVGAAGAADDVKAGAVRAAQHYGAEARGGQLLRKGHGVGGVGDPGLVHALHEVVHARADLDPAAGGKAEGPDIIGEAAGHAAGAGHVAAVDVHRAARHRGAVPEARRHAGAAGHRRPGASCNVVRPEVPERAGRATAVDVHHAAIHHGAVVVAAERGAAVAGCHEGPLVIRKVVLPDVRVVVRAALATEDVHGAVEDDRGVRLARGRRVDQPHAHPGVRLIEEHRLLAR
mmetsp:Transcript_18869/g.47450  ORF Transcript_18869/g.47450 Transcript_18869/m.47450 type:complete len:245 (+) Transcript_18869:358-1092(+)